MANTMAGDRGDLKQPKDIDPYGLLSDGDEDDEEKPPVGVIPYNPAILEGWSRIGG
jgi:hypothetical protein